MIKLKHFLAIIALLTSCGFSTTWSGTQTLNSSYTVTPGETLTILSGTNVVFSANNVGINVQGRLVADNVSFASSMGMVNAGITFQSTSSGVMNNCSLLNLTSLTAGVLIYSNDVIMNSITVQKNTAAGGTGIEIGNCSPTINYCNIVNASRGIRILSGSVNFPKIYNSTIVGSSYSIYNSSGSSFYIEGNYYGGSAPTIFGTAPDYQPYLSTTPLGANINIVSGASPACDINGSFLLMPGKNYTSVGSGLNVTNTGRLFMGLNPTTGAWAGGTTLRLQDSTNLTIASGGTFESHGTAVNNITNSDTRWGSFIINAGANATVQNINLSNGTIGITDYDGSSLTDLTFTGMSSSAILAATTDSGTYCRNSISGGVAGTYAYDIGTTCTITGNTFSSSVPNAIRISAGSPTIQLNNIGGASAGTGTAITYSGSGAAPVGNIINNNFNLSHSRAVNNSSSTLIYLQNNYWGGTIPATANFSGSNQIDYEPWYNGSYPGGTLTSMAPYTVGCVLPINGSNLSTIPPAVTFNIADVGYYGGTPIRARFQLSDGDPTFASPMYNTTSGAVYPSDAIVTYPVAGLSFGHTYYWRAWAENTTDGQGWSTTPNPVYSFSIQQPDVRLTLSTNPAISAANSGQTVTYQVDFTNIGTFGVSNALITAVLPDDVYSDGTVHLEQISGKGMGTITVTAYSDIAGTTVLGSASSTTDTTFTNIGGGAANNSRIRRFNILVPGITAGYMGRVRYQTVVK